MFVAIGTPQKRKRDSYATAPNLDLTLRSNGEELVQLMDSYGQFTQAGFDPPTVSPVLTLGAAGLIPNGWYGYIYVYAAELNYPLVDSGSGIGSIAPRSNPSPSGTIQMVAGPKHINVKVATTTRGDISHIWIYRTIVFTTQQEALDAVNAGTAFYVGEIPNNPNLATLTYDDNLVIAAGGECEIDNYPAPMFQYCAYFSPYFWGFGNDAYTADCSLGADGSFVIALDEFDMFPGRNRQLVTFEGISTGGYDGHGNFYYLNTGTRSGRAMLNATLTTNAPVDFSGTTRVTIKGQSNILYRSKPNNPLSWGETDLTTETRTPHLFAFRIGGGDGTAIAIIANLNLLKLDTRGPSICFVLNLRLAGTSSFEESLRELSRGYSVSNHFSQFSTQAYNSNAVLWGFDFKSRSILQCDGSSQIPISSKVFETIRRFLPFEFNHGIYDDATELAIFWMQDDAYPADSNTTAILFHVPTGNWSLHIDFDVLCSARILDSETEQYKTVVGTSYGLIGQAFFGTKANNWIPSSKPKYAKFDLISSVGDLYTISEVASVAIFDITHPEYWEGNYIFICAIDTTLTVDKLDYVICQIIKVIDAHTISILSYGGALITGTPLFGFIGAYPTEFEKYTQLSSSSEQKQLTEMFATATNIRNLSTIAGWGFQYGIELTLNNVFNQPASVEFFHFQFNEAQGYYNKDLSKGIEFSSIIGLRVILIGELLIEMKDYSLSFQNA